jgi:hypothetical protein
VALSSRRATSAPIVLIDRYTGFSWLGQTVSVLLELPTEARMAAEDAEERDSSLCAPPGA